MLNSKLIAALCLLPLTVLALTKGETHAASEPGPSPVSADPMIGEIQYVAFNFAPRGWAMCNGQLLEISQYSALFSLLGTTYGGDGRSTFALPDLRGRVPIHHGSGPGLSNYDMGRRGGSETEILSPAQMPPHAHSIDFAGTRGNPDNANVSLFIGADSFTSTPADTELNTVTETGGGQAHNNMQPYATVNAVIALQGIFPSRN